MRTALLYIGIALLGFSGCTEQPQPLRTGDLLFQVGRGSAMSEAITAATARDEALEFTHVGIAIPCERGDSVLEATGGGVQMTALADFLAHSARREGHPLVVAKRLKDTTGIAAAVRRARTLLGLPYDYSFRPDNDRYYCSELIYECYRRPDSVPVFTARSMNFRAPDGTLPRYWEELFERLGEPVPEGVLGTNPNDMARETALYEVCRWF